jgi:hypothetical protein
MTTEQETIRNAPSPDPSAAGRADDGLEASGREMLRYLLKAAAAMALLYFAGFFLARSPLWDRVNPSFFARPLNYAFETSGENADIVIFGDSTALLGVDPSQMSSALGVKVLNLVNTQPSLVVNDDMSLRHYLKQNRPPKLIVFYFAPWDFDYGHNDFNSRPTYDGEELLLRRGTPQEVLAFVGKHPREALMFPLKFYASAWEFALHHVPKQNQEAQLSATRGHIDNADPTTMSPACRFPQYLIDMVRFSWVHDLGERYRSPETKVLFYVAPVPACENVSEILRRPYDQLPASPPKAVPANFFVNDIRFIHPRTIAVPQLTEYLTEAARPVLASVR